MGCVLESALVACARARVRVHARAHSWTFSRVQYDDARRETGGVRWRDSNSMRGSDTRCVLYDLLIKRVHVERQIQRSVAATVPRPGARASESAVDDAKMRAVTASAPATTSDVDANARANANAANVADALAYVREVRARFVDESWRYHEFLRAMKAFKRGTCVALARGDDDARTTRDRSWTTLDR